MSTGGPAGPYVGTSGGVVEGLVCPCNTPWGGLGPAPVCPYHSTYTEAGPTYTGVTVTSMTPTLSDADIDRIAERMVEKLRSPARSHMGPIADPHPFECRNASCVSCRNHDCHLCGRAEEYHR